MLLVSVSLPALSFVSTNFPVELCNQISHYSSCFTSQVMHDNTLAYSNRLNLCVLALSNNDEIKCIKALHLFVETLTTCVVQSRLLDSTVRQADKHATCTGVNIAEPMVPCGVGNATETVALGSFRGTHSATESADRTQWLDSS